MKSSRLNVARKLNSLAFQRPKSEPVNVFQTGLKALNNDDVDAAIKAAAQLFVLGNLHHHAAAQRLHGQLTNRILAKEIRNSAFAFQGPRPSSALTAQALEGLFNNLRSEERRRERVCAIV